MLITCEVIPHTHLAPFLVTSLLSLHRISLTHLVLVLALTVYIFSISVTATDSSISFIAFRFASATIPSLALYAPWHSLIAWNFIRRRIRTTWNNLCQNKWKFPVDFPAFQRTKSKRNFFSKSINNSNKADKEGRGRAKNKTSLTLCSQQNVFFNYFPSTNVQKYFHKLLRKTLRQKFSRWTLLSSLVNDTALPISLALPLCLAVSVCFSLRLGACVGCHKDVDWNVNRNWAENMYEYL